MQMPRLIGVFAGRTCDFVGFVMYWFIFHISHQKHVMGTHLKHLCEVLLMSTQVLMDQYEKYLSDTPS